MFPDDQAFVLKRIHVSPFKCYANILMAKKTRYRFVNDNAFFDSI